MPSVLVTGASRGIGLAITRHLSEHGWDVYATARSADDLRDLGRLPNLHPLKLDITDRSAIASLPEQLPARLDGVVNNAGIIVQAVLPRLRAARGRVVFMSSVSGLITTPGTGAYSASKYALESLADALRIELRPWRIPVSLIEPGPTRTDMWGDALDDYDRMTNKLSPAHRELYAAHLAGTRKLLGRMQKLAGDPRKVVKVVDRALTSRHPKRRYRCDNVSRAQLALVSVSPAAATDALFAAAATGK